MAEHYSRMIDKIIKWLCSKAKMANRSPIVKIDDKIAKMT
jgi:hypothetical protein